MKIVYIRLLQINFAVIGNEIQIIKALTAKKGSDETNR